MMLQANKHKQLQFGGMGRKIWEKLELRSLELPQHLLMASRRIYTRKGDDGTSSTLGDAAADADGGVAESPRSKSDALFYALGTFCVQVPTGSGGSPCLSSNLSPDHFPASFFSFTRLSAHPIPTHPRRRLH